MPMVKHQDGLVLVCVNGCSSGTGGATEGVQAMNASEAKTTMRVTPGWNALMVAESDPIRFSPTMGAPVRLSLCEVCGYVELYAGVVVDKKVWG
jgi:hypothetical protein